MALVTTNLGELQLLDKMLKAALTVDEDYVLHLFKTNVTPDANSAPGSFVEADFTTYVAKTLTRANWNSSVTVAGKAQSSYSSAPLSWTCGASGNTIYGYWISGATSGVCLWAESFATARALASTDVLNITPTIQLDSAT
jgi:hypothetical protein